MQTIVPQETFLLDLLVTLSPSTSKTSLRAWIKEGRVTVDGAVAKRADMPLIQGQIVAVGAKAQYIAEKIRVIYEDPHLIAIEKPSGMLSVATAFEKGETAHALLKRHYHPRKVYVVHRLDQDTSGVMLFALSEAGYHGLKILFEKHEIERSYCAIVEGKLIPTSGTWQSYLYEDSLYFVHSTDDPEKGAIATTHYTVRHTSPRYTRLDVSLETGRKNQIRVHASSKGHSVVGDKKYGAATDPIHRLCLHAQLIAFKHPVSGKHMRFTSAPPGIFDRLVKP